jgi:hypothetical protein
MGGVLRRFTEAPGPCQFIKSELVGEPQPTAGKRVSKLSSRHEFNSRRAHAEVVSQDGEVHTRHTKVLAWSDG